MKKKIFAAIGVLIAGFAVLIFVTRTYFPTNIADTKPDHSEEMLRSRLYPTDLATFTDETEKIIPTLTKYGANWRFVGTEKSDGRSVIKAEVPVVIFTDDLRITAISAPTGVEVDVHSNSRVGKSDFGENRRHLLILLEALDKKFKQ